MWAKLEHPALYRLGVSGNVQYESFGDGAARSITAIAQTDRSMKFIRFHDSLDPKCSAGDLPYNQYGTKTKAAHLSPFIVVWWHTGKNSVYSPCRR